MLNTNESKNEKWVILVLCCLANCASGGLANARSVFLSPFCDDLGISRAAFSLVNTICSLTGSFVMVYVPRVIERIGILRTLIFGCTMQMTAYILQSFVTGLAGLACTAMMRTLSGSFFCMTVIFMIINYWFTTQHGLASSIMSSFTGVGGALFSPIFSAVITRFGWRNGERFYALCMLLLTLPMFLYKKNYLPAHEIDDSDTDEEYREPEKPVEIPKVDSILLILEYGFVGLGMCMCSYMANMAQTKGMSAQAASFIVSLIMIGNVLSKLVYGPVSDKIGVFPTAYIVFGINITGSIILLITRNQTVMYIAAFMYGCLFAIAGLGANLMARTLFGNSGYAQVFPKMSLGYSIFGSIMGPIVGHIYDSTGDFSPAFFIAIAGDIICASIAFVLTLRRDKRNREAAENT